VGYVSEEAEKERPSDVTIRALMAKEIADGICNDIPWGRCYEVIIRILLYADEKATKEIPDHIKPQLKERIRNVLGIGQEK